MIKTSNLIDRAWHDYRVQGGREERRGVRLEETEGRGDEDGLRLVGGGGGGAIDGRGDGGSDRDLGVGVGRVEEAVVVVDVGDGRVENDRTNGRRRIVGGGRSGEVAVQAGDERRVKAARAVVDGVEDVLGRVRDGDIAARLGEREGETRKPSVKSAGAEAFTISASRCTDGLNMFLGLVDSREATPPFSD